MNGIIERGTTWAWRKVFFLLFNIFSLSSSLYKEEKYNNVILLFFIKIKSFAISADVEQIHSKPCRKFPRENKRTLVDVREEREKKLQAFSRLKWNFFSFDIYSMSIKIQNSYELEFISLFFWWCIWIHLLGGWFCKNLFNGKLI